MVRLGYYFVLVDVVIVLLSLCEFVGVKIFMFLWMVFIFYMLIKVFCVFVSECVFLGWGIFCFCKY